MILITHLFAVLGFVNAGNASKCSSRDGPRITHQTAFISPISKTRRSRLWTANRPDPPSIKPPPLEDDILKGDDVEIEPLFDISASIDQEAVKELGVNLSKTYVAPIFSREVVRGVPPDIFKGALVSGAGLSVLAGKGVLLAGVTGIGLAYVATTAGPAGDSARVVGKATWSSTQNLLQLNKKYEVGKKIKMFLQSVLTASRAIGKSERLKSFTDKLINAELQEELDPSTVKIDDEVKRLVKEAEDTITSVQNMLEKQEIEEVMENESVVSLNDDVSIDTESHTEDELDTTSELAENMADESDNASSEPKLTIDDIDAESDVEVELDATSELAEDKQEIEEAMEDESVVSLNDDVSINPESNTEDELDTTSELAENMTDESDNTFNEPKLPIDDIEAESNVEVELDATSELAEDLADELDGTSREPEASMEDLYIGEDDWEDSIRLAESLDNDILVNIGGDIEDELENAPELSENMRDKPDDTSREFKVPKDEFSISFEAEGNNNEELDVARDLAKILIDESDDISSEPVVSMEEIGKAARAAVEQYEREQQEKEIDELKKMETSSSTSTLEVSQKYENLTVVKLKDILRSRGLKVAGRKADLIVRLKENE